MGKPKVVNKQRLRSRISNMASYTEIYISALILIGIAILSFRVIYDIKEIIFAITTDQELITVKTFMQDALELIIGIEFIKMLAKHTPSSAVEVLLYAIARKIIGDGGDMVEVLLGIVAIAVLFFIRKYLSTNSYQSDHNEYIVNGGLSIPEINKIIGSSLSHDYGNTAAGIIANIASKNEEIIEPGYEVVVDEMVFQVYSMDSDLIKQIKIIYDEHDDLVNKIKGLGKKAI